MWELIELREIRVFLVLAEELHFGRTATRLGLTQSRVSQSLRGFERKLGVRLFAAIEAYERGVPGRAVRIVDVSAADLLGALRRDEVDVVIARLPVDEPDLVVGPVMAHEARLLA